VTVFAGGDMRVSFSFSFRTLTEPGPSAKQPTALLPPVSHAKYGP
jgi:hypothetical protein